MKETEALKRWCPMVRFIMTPQDQSWQNRAMNNRTQFVERGTIEAHCIGSMCMWWISLSDDSGKCCQVK